MVIAGKKDLDRAIAPNEHVFTAFAERAVESTFGNPLVDGFDTQTGQMRELTG